MTVSLERQAQLREVLDEIVKFNPDAADLDPSDEADAQTIEQIAGAVNAAENHEPIKFIVERRDGGEEVFELQPVGIGPNGKVQYHLQYETPEGGLSPEGIDLLESLLSANLSAEIEQLIGNPPP